MAHKAGSPATPLLSFRLTGAHVSVCLMAKSQGHGDTALGTRVPPISVNLSLSPSTTPTCFFQRPVTGRAFLCSPPTYIPRLDLCFPFWGKTHGLRNKPINQNGLQLKAFVNQGSSNLDFFRLKGAPSASHLPALLLGLCQPEPRVS